MDTTVRTETVEVAITEYVTPKTFDTDHASQFTGSAYTGRLLESEPRGFELPMTLSGGVRRCHRGWASGPTGARHWGRSFQ
ncbi:hypothetical protein BH11PSE8_BH11PSE8_12730 [soil metagenome]